MNGMIHGMEAIGSMIKTGTMAIGPQRNSTTMISIYSYFQNKGKGKKGKKGRKAKMMREKEVNQEMEKASPVMFNLKLPRLLPLRTNHNNRPTTLPQHQVQGMVLFLSETDQRVWMC